MSLDDMYVPGVSEDVVSRLLGDEAESVRLAGSLPSEGVL
jgi:hypothetical protein